MPKDAPDSQNESTSQSVPAAPPALKLFLDLGPLAAFFVAYHLAGLMTATAVIMAATAAALVVSYVLLRRLPLVPVFTALIVGVFGGLTLWLDDEIFIKMKPTIINGLFAVILLGGLATGRALLKPLFEMAFKLTEGGWRQLSLRWALFFIAMALLNELVWRTMTTDFWVNFKVFGLLGLTFVFALSQLPFISRNGPDAESAKTAKDAG